AQNGQYVSHSDQNRSLRLVSAPITTGRFRPVAQYTGRKEAKKNKRSGLGESRGRSILQPNVPMGPISGLYAGLVDVLESGTPTGVTRAPSSHHALAALPTMFNG